jgi:hypothetical protein
MTDNNLIGHEVKAAPCAPPVPRIFLTWSATPIRTRRARTRTHEAIKGHAVRWKVCLANDWHSASAQSGDPPSSRLSTIITPAASP